ncbi:MAG: hypothetical protein JWN98_1714 [Abditibacteriota bacterium]|nr:hypothetical protein [Abditibacteriota bacterium]
MNSHEVHDKARSRKLMMSGAMLLVAAGIFGGFFYLQKQAGSADSAALPATLEDAMRERAAKRGMIYDSKTKRMGYPDLTPDEQQAFVAKLKLIREKWRPWARRNQSTLNKLLHAQASDEATLMSVSQTLPSNKSESGVSNRDLVPTKDITAAMQARLPMFTWQASRPGAVIPEKMRAQYEKTQVSSLKLLKDDFKRMRDIRLSRSMSNTEPTFSLWASGRITKSRSVRQNILTTVNGKSVIATTSGESAHEEIMPPFEFLR